MRKLVAFDPPPSDSGPGDPAWMQARRRLERYVDALGLPDGEARTLVAAALAEAEASRAVVPLPAAMAALQRRLAERDGHPPLTMPPIHRGRMVPEAVDRSALGFLLEEVLRPLLRGLRRPVTIRPGMLLPALAGAVGMAALLLR